ncbi:coproporphyrinogen III oxidase [Phormidium sp. LEGE 05292]|uniref:radical SAM family heme chaperone HemW n=1 Tax=[Phormidium] sp. LEGE 05292 TaxID=767427 RepID=UPI00187FF847|nr:radical SAM family heme chaperone HemW [Phormidium sp. LEGE 05292]MBE9228109.1 coproporphyrinogen III oxidase [Phormidium sp. LEGE 05292]
MTTILTIESNHYNKDLDIPTSAYVHIPFCRRRCFYCDFPISVVGDRTRGENSGTIVEYIDILCQEIAATPAPGKPLKTVFFGGGTPSLLSAQQIARILENLANKYGITSDAEISLEIDPATFDLPQLQGYKNAGITRFSLGVQAFQDELLQVCGRSHTTADILAAIDLIRQVDIPEFSIDLISGLPKQTIEQWEESLRKAVELNPTHISVYDLIIEDGTAFGRYYQPGSQPLPTDETTAQMYRLTQQILTLSGYEHYEISNYAQPGHQCRHNRVYWENRPYYAFGMGAASYLNRQRFTRPKKRKEYYAWVQHLIASDGILDAPQIDEHDILLETLMLGLRLAEGLKIAVLAEKFGRKTLEKIWHCLQPYYQTGWVEISANNSANIALSPTDKLPVTGRLKLTDPEGFLFSNTVLAALFSQLEKAEAGES